MERRAGGRGRHVDGVVVTGGVVRGVGARARAVPVSVRAPWVRPHLVVPGKEQVAVLAPGAVAAHRGPDVLGVGRREQVAGTEGVLRRAERNRRVVLGCRALADRLVREDDAREVARHVRVGDRHLKLMRVVRNASDHNTDRALAVDETISRRGRIRRRCRRAQIGHVHDPGQRGRVGGALELRTAAYQPPTSTVIPAMSSSTTIDRATVTIT